MPHADRRAYYKAWREDHKERVKELNVEYYKKYGDDIRKKQKVRDKIYRTTKKLDYAYRQRKMFWSAKHRAKKKSFKLDR